MTVFFFFLFCSVHHCNFFSLFSFSSYTLQNFKETSPGNEREGREILLLQDCVQGVRELLQAPQQPSCMQELHGMRKSLSLEHNPPWELQPRGVE
jgi:hypothetical protein